MRDPQNSAISNEQPSPTQNEGPSREKNPPSQNSYYYDDATGYEIYHEESDEEDDEECAEEKSRPNQVVQPGVPVELISQSEMHLFGAVLHTERSLLSLPDSGYGPLN